MKKLNNDISINSYLRDLITVFNFLMRNNLMEQFKMKSIKTSKANVETYTDSELSLLLAKTNLKHCSFIEYQSWVMVNFFSTDVCLLLCTCKTRNTVHTDEQYTLNSPCFKLVKYLHPSAFVCLTVSVEKLFVL